MPPLSLLGLVLLASTAHAAPPVTTKPVTKLPISSAPKVDPTPRVIDTSKVTGVAPLSKAQIAKLAGVSPSALGESVTLSPAHPIEGSTYLTWRCARYHDPSRDEVFFAGELYDACGTTVGVEVVFQTEQDHDYMIDCVGDPGDGNAWYFGRTGSKPWQEIKYAKSRFAFVFTAPHDEHIGVLLQAKAKTSYKINRCTVTPLGE